MVQKSAPARGRPRAYDPDVALGAAMEAFWQVGFSATSLDDLSAATGMNRPSLYGAFGDKHQLYLKALERYRAAARESIERSLDYEVPLRQALEAFYDRALGLYLSGTHPRGCFMIGTSLTEAVEDDAIRVSLADGLADIDAALEKRIRFAVKQGNLRKGADPAALTKMASAALYSLAIQSRIGASRKALEATRRAALDLIVGPK